LRYGIRQYRFVWICPEGHWILVDQGGQDQLIPLRVSDLLGALGSRSDDEKRKKREGVPGVRVESSPARSVARFQASVMLWWVLGDGETTTSFGTTRRARECERRPRLHAGEEERDGRRCTSAGALRARVDLLVLLRIK
jgi:hypothetical protein